MSWTTEIMLMGGVLGFLIFFGMRIPFAIGLAGVFALFVHSGMKNVGSIGLINFDGFNSFTLTAVPLFIFMSAIIMSSGMTKRLFEGISALLGKLPGGLFHVNIIACAIFAAICGSSVATAAAIGTVAIPELKKRSYNTDILLGSLAAGGTLGILIPPSIAMIIYASFTELDVPTLFIAGVIPGICLSLLYMTYIFIRAILNPSLTPQDVDLTAGGQRMKKVMGIVPSFILIGVVMGGLYGGVMTATEAAGIGALGGVILCFFSMPRDPRALLNAVWEAAREAVSTTCFIMFIVLAAQIFSFAAATSGLMSELTKFIMSLNLSTTTFILLVYLIVTIMGCFLEGIAIISLTTPVFFPLLKGFGINPIWWGVALVVLVELAQVTPPFGINLFVIQGISENPLTDVIRGTFPFMIIMGIFLFVILAFPQMALWLPSQMHK